jgi:hypothetical protein
LNKTERAAKSQLFDVRHCAPSCGNGRYRAENIFTKDLTRACWQKEKGMTSTLKAIPSNRLR